MLIKQPQVEIASKVVKDASGVFVRAYFALMTIEGHTEVRFLGTRPLEAEIAAPTAVLSLPGTSVTSFGESVISHFESILSPLSSLAFFVSQPTRAPSFA
ncbi:MAG: hypothetical protein Q8L64_04665 [bacterium]|nr:hypothetical protein [bacterium]